MPADRSDWFKSSYSAQNGECVEARCSAAIWDVRDSKNQTGPVLSFGPKAWSAFVADLRTEDRP